MVTTDSHTTDLDLPAPYRPHSRFAPAFAACPLIAILRGIEPGREVGGEPEKRGLPDQINLVQREE